MSPRLPPFAGLHHPVPHHPPHPHPSPYAQMDMQMATAQETGGRHPSTGGWHHHQTRAESSTNKYEELYGRPNPTPRAESHPAPPGLPFDGQAAAGYAYPPTPSATVRQEHRASFSGPPISTTVKQERAASAAHSAGGGHPVVGLGITGLAGSGLSPPMSSASSGSSMTTSASYAHPPFPQPAGAHHRELPFFGNGDWKGLPPVAVGPGARWQH